tara:strand:+ start:35501 stop:35815 length:315 start_codon:yes stop_codon:yes gene_type:complete
VRAPSEIAALAFDAPKVIAMPMSELGQRFRALPRDRALNVASSAGERSLKATCFQMFPGYEKVANMEDGVTEWGRKGFPVRGDVSSLASNSACCAPSSPSGKCC